ncbi:phosphoribosylanthranilate isomerase [Betaproteobacteria bacterium PRO4]|uniref:phosphoribosylanthranilate isomerase n=1 Tax=Nitrosomonas sp. TaxID=42353 RepID=UPI00256D3D17|nr:phosphoribosylanthranilate isomerase [Nitrosomonas sp.]MDL1866114.1 phosphoribosylanthranilate isomerase [Betaproteobacteria bacterium PRO4]
MHTRVKICGITRLEDAMAAVQYGADAIGFVLWPQSERYISPEKAGQITKCLPPFVQAVGVYVNPDKSWVETSSAAAGLDLLQFHGDESPDFCSQFSLPYIKAVRVRNGLDLLQYARRYGESRGLLLDAYAAGIPGGTGHVFDWNLIPAELPLPWVLSGGLHPGNVAEAIGQTHPSAVDVSSGVEVAKGIKDIGKISVFMQGVRSCEDI